MLYDDERRYSEGHEAALSITAKKRSKEVRDACFKHYGYSCQICGFDFEKRYGDIGTGFIEVYHISLLPESEGCAVTDPIKDLLLVCSGCHSMLHRQKPPLLVEALQSRIKQPPVYQEDFIKIGITPQSSLRNLASATKYLVENIFRALKQGDSV